jgi:hypothetical protein
MILSEEGLSQGDPLAMILYGVALLPLVESLCKAVPEATTPGLRMILRRLASCWNVRCVWNSSPRGVQCMVTTLSLKRPM